MQTNVLKLATAYLLVIVAPILVTGATVSDYQARLDKAHRDVESMISALQSGKRRSEIDVLAKQISSNVRKAIPRTETIELGRTSIETQNGWLHDDFDKFEKQSDTTEQIRILSGTSERLSSIQDHVNELANSIAGPRTKDDDKQKLNQILSREEYQKPADKGKSAFQVWLDWFLNWLQSLFPSRPNLPSVDPAGFKPLSVIIQIIIYGLVIGLMGFLIYKFGPFIAERFSRKVKAKAESRIILGEHIDGSRSASDLFDEAENFARQGDLRAAIRKAYIALLCDLADRKVIGLARHKTNRDYLRDVRQREPLFVRMKNATGSFERYWYGSKTPKAKDWEEFRDQYRAAVNDL